MATLNEIRGALTGITINRAKALVGLASTDKEYPDTGDIRIATNFSAVQLGGMGSALTKILINGQPLITTRPIKTDRNNSQYIWNSEVATKHHVLQVLKEFGIKI